MCSRAQKASPSFQLLLKLVMSMFCRKRKKTRERHRSQGFSGRGGGAEAAKPRQAEPLQKARWARAQAQWCQRPRERQLCVRKS